MALILTANISATAYQLRVTGTVPSEIAAGYQFRLDDELMTLVSFVESATRFVPDRNHWNIQRGQGEFANVAHTAGASIKGARDGFVAGTDQDEPDPFSSGGPGGPVDASDVTVSPAVAGETDVQGALEALAVAPAPQPTVQDLIDADVLALATDWDPLTSYSPVFVPAFTYTVTFMQPGNGFTYVDLKDSNTIALTGSEEPAWPEVIGQSVSDGAYTWYCIAEDADFPPTPQTWAPETVTPGNAAVWPTTPDGTLWFVYPGYPGTTGATEPDWDSAFSVPTGYTASADGDVYWVMCPPLPGDYRNAGGMMTVRDKPVSILGNLGEIQHGSGFVAPYVLIAATAQSLNLFGAHDVGITSRNTERRAFDFTTLGGHIGLYVWGIDPVVAELSANKGSFLLDPVNGKAWLNVGGGFDWKRLLTTDDLP